MVITASDYLLFDGIDLELELPDDDNGLRKVDRFLEEVERFVFRKLKIYGLDENKLNKDDPNVKDAFCYQVRHFLKYGRDGQIDTECWETLQNSGYVRFISF